MAIHQDADGRVCLDHLREELERHADRPLMIGSFSAASNVTGIVSDTHGISDLLHEHGALGFWDFAAARPTSTSRCTAPAARYKDAIFLSPHKFIGGPHPGRARRPPRAVDQPGARRPRRRHRRLRQPDEHRYLDDPAHREEGGTPAIIESIRAGLVFQLKQAVGIETIRAHEEHLLSPGGRRVGGRAAIEILGNLDAPRLSIVSFVLRAPSGRYLHHNYVVALLNDLFGVQARGGCSCAGPYGHRLLGIDIDRSHQFEAQITGGCEGIKPGWVRVNFNYFVDDAACTYIVEAVRLVAREGWRLLGDYRFDPVTGLWRHRDGVVEPPMRLSGRVVRRRRHDDVALAHDDGPRLGAQGAPRRGPRDHGRRDATGLVGPRPPGRRLRRPPVVRAAGLLAGLEPGARATPWRRARRRRRRATGSASASGARSVSTTSPWTSAHTSTMPANATPITSWVMLTGCQSGRLVRGVERADHRLVVARTTSVS